MAADIESYNPQVPADLSALSRDELVEYGRKVASFSEHVEAVSRWALGDLACAVETSYGESELAKYAEEVGVKWSTLRDYAQVSAAFPASCRLATNSWTVYRTLAAQDDRLELVAGDRLTVDQAREIVQERARKKHARWMRQQAKERKKNAAAGKKKVIAGKVEPGTTATQAKAPEPVAPPVTTTTETATVDLVTRLGGPAPCDSPRCAAHRQAMKAEVLAEKDAELEKLRAGLKEKDAELAEITALKTENTRLRRRLGEVLDVNFIPALEQRCAELEKENGRLWALTSSPAQRRVRCDHPADQRGRDDQGVLRCGVCRAALDEEEVSA